MDYAKGYGFLSLDWRVLDAVGFKLMGKVPVQSDVGLVIWGVSWVREFIQEVGRSNFPHD